MDGKPPQAAGECNIEQFYARQLRDVIAMWQDAGIEQVHARPVSLGGGVVMWGVWH